MIEKKCINCGQDIESHFQLKVKTYYGAKIWLNICPKSLTVFEAEEEE